MRFQKIHRLAFVLILTVGMLGCGLFEHDTPTSPISPTEGASQLTNFWVKAGPGQKIEVSTEDGELKVSVPVGSYLLSYTTTLGTFYLVFEALENVTLVIGLQPGDEILEAYLQEGEIVVPEGSGIVVEETGAIIVYILPDADEEDDGDFPEWFEIFEGDFVLIILISDGEVVLDDEDDEDGEDGEDGGEGQEEGEASDCGTGKFMVTVIGEGFDTVKPEGGKCVPAGASISIKFSPCPDDVTIEWTSEGTGVAVIDPYGKGLQCLGNGDGHLVIHGVDADLTVTATPPVGNGTAGTPGKPGKKPKDE